MLSFRSLFSFPANMSFAFYMIQIKTAFVISADTQRIATAGVDHKIKIWETATGKASLEIQGDLSTMRAVMDKTDAVAKGTVEVAWQNEAIKKAEKDVTDLAARLKKANELADIATQSSNWPATRPGPSPPRARRGSPR